MLVLGLHISVDIFALFFLKIIVDISVDKDLSPSQFPGLFPGVLDFQGVSCVMVWYGAVWYVPVG